MAKKTLERTFEDALTWLRDHQFEVLEAPGASHRVFLKKMGVSAAIERGDDGGTRVFARPGFLLGGEISKLVDKGYQKFLKTSKLEVPATADHLRAVHQFSEELREGIGAFSLYNESLGTVSDAYVYDRVTDRENPEPKRKKRPWEDPQNEAQARGGNSPDKKDDRRQR